MSKAGTRLVSPEPGVIAKIRAFCNVPELALCTQSALSHELSSPRRLSHSPLSRTAPYVRTVRKLNYIALEWVPGITLSSVLNDLSTQELEHVTSQLKDIVVKLRSIWPPKPLLGSVTGGPYRNNPMFPVRSPRYVFSSSGESIDYYRQRQRCTENLHHRGLCRVPTYSSSTQRTYRT